MTDLFNAPTLLPAHRPQTNPRYRTFTQAHFTAGDEEQFMQAKNETVLSTQNIPSPPNPVWNFSLSELYTNPTTTTAYDTFKYMFYKFKKGIFVQIKDNRLQVFLPFSNANYMNEWSHKIQVPKELAPSKHVLPAHLWYANNYLVRYENPLNENDTGLAQIKNMFEELCAVYTIPDIEFFVNRRDFPLLKANLTEPYDAIYGAGVPLVSHKYSSYLPILSMVEGAQFADLAMPTPDDWMRVRAMEKPPKFFATSKRSLKPFQDKFCSIWENKKPVAVFRGSSTGPGFHSNVRIRLCEMTQDDPRFDTGITDYSTRYQITGGCLERARQSRTVAKFMSLEDQSRYKYIIHVSGHVQAYRLSAELAMHSVVLMVEDARGYKLWFEKKLEPWVHFVPVKADLSDLGARVDWCRQNDAQCKTIAMNARAFYNKYLSKHGCLNYLYEMLHAYRSKIPLYLYPSVPLADERRLNARKIASQLQPVKFKISSPILTNSRCFLTLVCPPAREPVNPARVVFANKNTTIKQCFNNTVTKYARHLDHEKIIGIACVNELLRHIPNFVYTAGGTRDSLELEYIPGMTFQAYIQSRAFIFEDWLVILKQVALALAVAQTQHKFVHHDVCPWNILLHEPGVVQTIDYVVDEEYIVRARTRLVPVLIDYGRSYAVTQHGEMRSWNGYESFKDFLCLMIMSAYEVVKHQHLGAENQRGLVNLFNTVLAGQAPYYRPCANLYQLTHFLEVSHKFSNISFLQHPVIHLPPRRLLDMLEAVKSNLCSFERVRAVEYTFIGKVSSIYELPPTNAPALFQRYMLQQLWLMTVDGPARASLVQRAGSFPEVNNGSIYIQKYQLETYKWTRVRTMLMSMLICAGPFALKDEERARIRDLLKKICVDRESNSGLDVGNVQS